MARVTCHYCGQDLGTETAANQTVCHPVEAGHEPTCLSCAEIVMAAHRHWRLAKNPKRLEALIELIRRA